MKKSITPNQIKESNRNLIYQYIYKNPGVSQLDITYHLHLSRPTVTTNLSSLEEDGLIEKAGRLIPNTLAEKHLPILLFPIIVWELE